MDNRAPIADAAPDDGLVCHSALPGAAPLLKRRLIGGLIVFAAVLAAALFGIETRPAGFFASFWPANAVALGLMLRYRRILAHWGGWVGMIAAFFAADLLTGSTLFKTAYLTMANLAGIVAGFLLFSRLDAARLNFRHSATMIWFSVYLFAACAAAGSVGMFAGPLFFGREALDGFVMWSVSELVNYVAILPILLTMPTFNVSRDVWRRRAALLRDPVLYLPVILFSASILLQFELGGPIAAALPVPALLLAALVYDVFLTAVMVLVFTMWTMIGASFGVIFPGMPITSYSDMVALRMGVMLLSLAPITVASVMAMRTDLLLAKTKAQRAVESAMESRSLMLATMAHELRTPLNSIIGFSDLMVTKAAENPAAKTNIEHAAIIRDSGRYLLDLVNDLLDTARVEAGATTLEPTVVASEDLVQQSIRLVRGMAHDRNVRIAVDKGDWPFVQADPRAIKQVLINLLSNAVKFSPPESTVGVGFSVRNGRLSVSVQDYGPGIAPENLKFLGQPYFQAGSTDDRLQGSGLGLALSRKLIELHGGTLRVESTLGEGTTVFFDLPVTTIGRATGQAPDNVRPTTV
ncbi:hypothetical protein HH303_08390 [Rhodospirillaceae bacterium KN72]|uniref:histidine kinase n=1 Tax=Pacificispira spongiicola TaxID=2729598 RepID=A0A7Y0HEA3_9PROT|nr:HAMP domain-containing sensor histidine kinase [Pacificispira spongiicola]NMM44495.1 hypothetical protein [Pacificispira spongiicola]